MSKDIIDKCFKICKQFKKVDKYFNDDSDICHQCVNTTYTKIYITDVAKISDKYPDEFINFCTKNNLKPPNINSGNGKALSLMLEHKYKYFTRDVCDEIVKKFNIKTKDSIQLFNKHSQWGIKTNSGFEKGKLYIVYPYDLSPKYNMRKDFKFKETENNLNDEIEKIKSTIKFDYIDIPNEKWQLGHKNPVNIGFENNMLLQPPIQQKYRDEYIFIDTLTKIPVPKKLERMIKKKEIIFSKKQINEYLNLFSLLKLNK